MSRRLFANLPYDLDILAWKIGTIRSCYVCLANMGSENFELFVAFHPCQNTLKIKIGFTAKNLWMTWFTKWFILRMEWKVISFTGGLTSSIYGMAPSVGLEALSSWWLGDDNNAGAINKQWTWYWWRAPIFVLSDKWPGEKSMVFTWISSIRCLCDVSMVGRVVAGVAPDKALCSTDRCHWWESIGGGRHWPVDLWSGGWGWCKVGVQATMVLSVVTAVKVPGHHQPAHQPCLHSLHPATSAVLMAASDSRSQ